MGPPRLYTEVDVSPDGRFFLVSWLERPYSHMVPCGRFPKRVQLWDRAGALIVIAFTHGQSNFLQAPFASILYCNVFNMMQVPQLPPLRWRVSGALTPLTLPARNKWFVPTFTVYQGFDCTHVPCR